MAGEFNKGACTLCGGSLDSPFAEHIVKGDKQYSVSICRECSVGVNIPLPAAEEVPGLYAAESYRLTGGKRFNALVEAFVYLFRMGRQRRIEKYVTGGSILDIGCGRGLFLALMKRAGWEAAGVELNRETAAHVAAAYGIPVVSGNPSEWGLREEGFDVITLFHVLEHVLKPSDMISESRRLLKKGGLLVVTVPDINSLQASAGKGLWFHLDVPYHLYHFSEAGLSGLLRKNTFRILRVRRFSLEHNPFGWLQTLLNLTGIRENFFYNLLKRPELRRRELPGFSARDAILTLALLPLAVPLSVILSLFESFILRRGGTIEVYAVKE